MRDRDLLDDVTLEYVEFVPRVKRRKRVAMRVALALATGLVASVILYALAFRLANPDSVELAPEIRRARHHWLDFVTVLSTILSFGVAGALQWPGRRRDRSRVPIEVRREDSLQQLRHRRQLA